MVGSQPELRAEAIRLIGRYRNLRIVGMLTADSELLMRNADEVSRKRRRTRSITLWKGTAGATRC